MLAAVSAIRTHLNSQVFVPQSIATRWENALAPTPEPTQLTAETLLAFDYVRVLATLGHTARVERPGEVEIRLELGEGQGDAPLLALADDVIGALKNANLAGATLTFTDLRYDRVGIIDGRSRVAVRARLRYKQIFTRGAPTYPVVGPTLESIGNTLRKRAKDLFADPLLIPLVYDDQPPALTPDAAAWARFSLPWQSRVNVEGGSGGTGRLVTGAAAFLVYTRKGDGDAYAYQLAAVAEAAMRLAVVDGVSLGIPSTVGRGVLHYLSTVQQTLPGQWWQLRISCPFESYVM